MLTTSVIKNASCAAQYYSKEDNYYLSEVDAKEASMWLGEGAARLGLSGKVEEKVLHDLLHGKLPNGNVIGLQKDGTINHRPGHDLCFQAPKSVSILALDGEDKRLYDAHLDAVKETLKVIERDCAQAKVFKDKQISFENTKNLTVALIPHTTSRKLDLHLHHHALVMNCTQRENGSWRALASSKVTSDQINQINGFSERIYNHRIYYGLIYQASLANKVISCGYTIETVGPHGMWEIKEVPKEAREILSKRRKEIEQKLKDLNYKSLKAADVATMDTREKKPNNLDREHIKQINKDELSSLGFSSKDCVATVNKRRELGINSVDVPKSNSSISANAKEAVRDAIEHLSQYSLKLDYAKVAACALEFSIGNTLHRDVVHALDDVIQKREIIPLDKSDSLFVTKDLIATEKSIMDLVATSKGSVNPVELKSNEISRIEGQQETIETCLKILQSKDRLHLIEHMSADTKELISAVLGIAESSGKTVRVLSPNRIMTYDINENIKRKPNSLWQWLVSLGKPEIGECVSGFLYKYQDVIDHSLFSRQDKDIFIVNNAETLGSSDLKSLAELTAKTNARVIFLRDTSVRQGFGAGSPMETLKQAGLETDRLILTSDRANRINRVPEVKAIQDDAVRTIALAKAFAVKDDKERANTIVLVGAKSQIKKTNEALRNELKDRGKLAIEEFRFSVLNHSGLSKVESNLAHKYQNNMVIRFYTKGNPVTNWSVDSTNRNNNSVRLRLENPYERNVERVSWNPKKHRESNCSIFKREVLGISQGDKLIATANMKMLRINQAERFTVTALGKNYIELLSSKNKTCLIGKEELKDTHFDYAYTTTLSKSSQKQADHVIADFKAYALDKPTLNDLNLRTKESLTIFTNDAKTIQKRFGIVPVKLTGAETILKAAGSTNLNPERLVNDKTTREIKHDIEAATAVLSIKDDSAESTAKKAVDYALEKITSRKAGFTHKDLVAEALKYALTDQIAISGKEVTHESIMSVITEKRSSGELVMGKHFEDGTRWTTKEILVTERSIIERLKVGVDKLEPLLDKERTDKLIADSKLTEGQKSGCRLIATTKDQFVIIQGYAGTGKTTMFGQIRDMVKEINNTIDDPGEFNNVKDKESKEKLTEDHASIQILALAPTHKAVKELKKVGIEAQTLKSFLLEQQRAPSNMDNKLIVLDEDSMVSNRDFDKFLDLVKDSKVRVALCGDITQHISIESGKPVEISLKAKILKVVYLTEIVRQKNPVLKSAVEDIISKDYKSAFEKIASENPQHHIARDNQLITAGGKGDKTNAFFNDLKHSIVEIDNNDLKPGEATIEQRIAEDYLTRTPETREKTVVIVHANHDRRVITTFIRSGLKEQGEIDKDGMVTNCLVSKGLTAVEHKSPNSYNIDDIVKIGKEYYRVEENNPELKSIMLKDELDKPRYFYPEKQSDKYNIEVYENIKSELAVGDIIRLTKTDKERERYANFEYKVEAIANNAVTLKSKDKDNEQLILRLDNLKDAHWDYAQTVTGYGIQGGSKTYAIDFEASYRKNLTNQRSFYIGASRAIQHLIIYTDNREKLLDRIVRNRGDKYAALEVVGEFGQARTSIDKDKSNKKALFRFKDAAANYSLNHPDHQNNLTKPAIQTRPGLKGFKEPQVDFNRINELLNSSAEVFVERILGKPNLKLSTPTKWRYGNKGSLVINMSSDKRGLWHNFETGESGNLISLIKKETGLSSKDMPEYVTNISGTAPSIKKDHISKNIDTNHNKDNSKTRDYALALAKESTPIKGTIAEKYLKDIRGIKNLNSDDIRYHPGVYVGKGEKGKNKHLPAMIAIGRDKDGNIKCVQATYLDPKTANKADVDVKKRTYSSPAQAAVTLKKDESKDRISYIAEGVETGLSIKDAVKKGEVFAALGKSNFATLDPEKLGPKVVFCLDNDGKDIYQDSIINKAIERLIQAGKDVSIAIPDQINKQKTDFNDVARINGNMAVTNYLNNIKSYDKTDKNLEDLSIVSYKNNDNITKKGTQNRIAKTTELEINPSISKPDLTKSPTNKIVEKPHDIANFKQKEIIINNKQLDFERDM